MAHTDIDRVNGFTIRKLHSPDKSKTFGYLTGIRDDDGSLFAAVEHDNLTAARKHLGFNVKNAPKTKPKSSNPQNCAGYDPHKR